MAYPVRPPAKDGETEAPIVPARGLWGDISTRGFADSAFFEIHRLCELMTGHDEWTQDEILAVLNGGVHLLNHVGHSMTNDNMRLHCDVLDQRLENEFAFFDYSGGCYPGSFDNRLDPVFSENRVSPQDSFAEQLLLGEHGAFGMVMFTRFGVGELLQRTFWDAVFAHGLRRLGEIHNCPRIEAAAFAADRYVRWQLYSLTLFGDPALILHTSQSDTPLIGLPAGPDGAGYPASGTGGRRRRLSNYALGRAGVGRHHARCPSPEKSSSRLTAGAS